MVSGYDASGGWRPPIVILTGSQGEGKTSFLLKFLADAAKMGMNIGGITAPRFFRNGVRWGFSIVDLRTGRSTELCTVAPAPGTEQHGPYYFKTAGLSFGYRALRPPEPGTTDLLIVDEVGRFELDGDIWAESIDRLLDTLYPPMIWAVRRTLVDAVADRWPETRQVVVDIRSADSETMIERLLEAVMKYRAHVRGESV